MAAEKKQKQARLNEVMAVLLLLVGLFTFVSLLFFNSQDSSFYTSHPNPTPRNVTGIVGVYLSHYLILLFGFSSYAIPALFLFWSSCFFLQKVPQKKMVELLGLLVSMIAVASIASLSVVSAWKVKAGGFIGYFIASNLETYFGLVGGLIISVCCLFLAMILATDFLLYPLFQRFWDRLQVWVSQFSEMFEKPVEVASRAAKELKSKSKSAMSTSEKAPSAFDLKKMEAPEIKFNLPTIKKETKTTDEEFDDAMKLIAAKAPKPPKSKPAAEVKETPKNKPDQQTGDYKLPGVDLLSLPDTTQVVIKDDLRANSRILEDTLNDFGIEAKVTAVEQGPVITRYELMPAPGVKVNRIVSLGDDLALAMRATSVRFIAPIPGKAAIGIEIPNSTTVMVYLRELLESDEFKGKKFELPLTLGKDTSGKPLVAELNDMPHLLIAGTTGSGKTVCVNALIAGMLASKTPDELKFVMIDPKMVELAIYKDIPHMLTPVVTDSRKAPATLNWVVNEMEKRYRFFATCGTRNIKAFNSRTVKEGEKCGEEIVPARLPYIVVVIDELADLMMVAQEKVEGAITRLAQLSRAVGIHLILATQRPSVDVITGVIKANFPSRISFKVASKVDSRTVLDVNGAEKLLGKGDMLFMEPGQPKPIRGQAAYIKDDEINKVVDFIKAQRPPQYLQELEAIQNGTAQQNRVIEKDELYDEAVRVVFETRQASVSVLQRRLRLGYGRAARIIDTMEQEGLVGPFQGAKSRELYIDKYMERIEQSSPASPPEVTP